MSLLPPKQRYLLCSKSYPALEDKFGTFDLERQKLTEIPEEMRWAMGGSDILNSVSYVLLSHGVVFQISTNDKSGSSVESYWVIWVYLPKSKRGTPK